MTTSPPEPPAGPGPEPEPGPREERLHPAGIAISAVGSVNELLVPLVLVIVLGAGSGGLGRSLALGAIGLIAAVVMGIVRWATTVYRVAPDRIVLRSGVLSPDEHLVPRSRISGIDTVQGPLQRVFGVVELRVQAAGGGGGADVVLRAVSPARAREIRIALGHPAEPVAPDALWRLAPGALLAGALTAPQAGVLLPVLAGAGALVQDSTGDRRSQSALAERLPDTAGETAMAIGLLALAALVLSVAAAIVIFGGFEARRESGRLRIRRGLLQRSATTIPLARIHGVRIIESPLRQPLGLAAVRIETVAHATTDRAEQTLLPLVRRRDVSAVVGALVPGIPIDDAPLERPPGRARRRYAVPPTLAGLAAGGLLALVLPAAWPLIALFAIAGLAFGLLRHRDAGWALDGARVTVRSRAFSRVTLVARTARLQAEELRVTPFQARADLATLGIAVARGRRAHVAHLDGPVARTLFERLRAGAEAPALSPR